MGAFHRLAKGARSVVGMFGQFAMQTAAAVAGKVAVIVGVSDHAAMAALVVQLVRVGERSLAAFGDIAHLQR